jgi:protein phosphatase
MTELNLNIASFCDAGIKPLNEDSVGFYLPSESYPLATKGAALCLADGVSTAEAGKEASETAVNHFIEEYYRTPDSWRVAHCAEKILSTLNLNLFRKSNEFSSNKGFLCTFSSIVIKGSTGYFFHVGDSRIYLLRKGELRQITKDHTARVSEKSSVLARALGMDNVIHIDNGSLELEVGDRLLLTSDGVHDFVEHAELEGLVGSKNQSMQEIVQEVKRVSLARHSNDNLSAVLAEIMSLNESDQAGFAADKQSLPFPPDLTVGMKLDGYVVEKELFASSRSQIYLVRDEESGHRYAMKTPSINYDDDKVYIERFIQEEWVGLRIRSKHVVRVIKQERDRTALYYLMEYIEGLSLDKWMAENLPPSPKQAIKLIRDIAAGVQSFHDHDTVHQDLKPANIIVDQAGEAILVDFGSVYVAGLAELGRGWDDAEVLGTAGYGDPNYLLGRNSGFAGDVYALATITYEMFTGTLPYGEAINSCHTKNEFDRLRYRPAAEINPQIPFWFDRALEKGASFDLELRYPSIASLMRDLTRPNLDFFKEVPESPNEANKALFWKLMSGFWFLTFVLVVYLFSQV